MRPSRESANQDFSYSWRSIARLILSVMGVFFFTPFNILSWFVFTLLCVPVLGQIPRCVMLALRFATAVACLPIEALLCRFGIMPEKRLRLRVVILRDANGLEACGRNAVLLQLFQLIRLFKRRANIKVVPFRADVLNGHSSWSANDYLLHDEVIAPAAVLDCRLHRRWALGIAHAVLTWRVCRYCFWQGWRRLPGHGSPLFVFAMADVAPFFYRPAQSLADGRSGGQCNPHGRGHH